MDNEKQQVAENVSDFRKLHNMLASIRAQARLEMWFVQSDLDRIDALLAATATPTHPVSANQPDGGKNNSDYQRGFNDGYQRRDDEVMGSLA